MTTFREEGRKGEREEPMGGREKLVRIKSKRERMGQADTF